MGMAWNTFFVSNRHIMLQSITTFLGKGTTFCSAQGKHPPRQPYREALSLQPFLITIAIFPIHTTIHSVATQS